MATTKQKGDSAEDFAAEWLINRGYSILNRNYRTRFFEIDIIAEKENTVVFIEVKYRKCLKFGTPAEAVTVHKIKKIIKGAVCYSKNITDKSFRFDVIEIFGDFSVNHIESAFTLDNIF